MAAGDLAKGRIQSFGSRLIQKFEPKREIAALPAAARRSSQAAPGGRLTLVSWLPDAWKAARAASITVAPGAPDTPAARRCAAPPSGGAGPGPGGARRRLLAVQTIRFGVLPARAVQPSGEAGGAAGRRRAV